MRPRNVFAALGLGAFALLCLTPDSAQAQRRRLFGGGGAPSGTVVYDQAWQPGYYGAPQAYGPGASYGPGVSYGPGATYAPGMSYGPGASYAPQMYQPQPYGYPMAAPGGCPPGQPLPQSAL